MYFPGYKSIHTLRERNQKVKVCGCNIFSSYDIVYTDNQHLWTYICRHSNINSLLLSVQVFGKFHFLLIGVLQGWFASLMNRLACDHFFYWQLWAKYQFKVYWLVLWLARFIKYGIILVVWWFWLEREIVSLVVLMCTFYWSPPYVLNYLIWLVIGSCYFLWFRIWTNKHNSEHNVSMFQSRFRISFLLLESNIFLCIDTLLLCKIGGLLIELFQF